MFGCSSIKTQKNQFVDIDKKFQMHNYKDAISNLESAKEKFYSKKDRVLYYLDLGMLCHYDKQYKKSNEMLDKAEQGIDELFTKSVSRATASLLLNDNVLEYSGEDYEDIYLNIFKALNYIELDLFDDAFVEIRKINNKLSQLEQKHTKIADKFNLSKNKKTNFKAGKNKFHNSALGRYLSMLLYRIEGNLDDARIDLKKIDEAWKLQSQIYHHSKPDFSNYLKLSKKVKVNFITFVGRAPEKKAKTLYIHTEKNLIIISTTKENSTHKESLKTLDTINWYGIQEGYHFKFQLPIMKKRRNNIGVIKVVVDGSEVKKMELLESLEDVALETFKVKKTLIYLKTITRTIIKGLATQKGKEKLVEKINNPLLSFATRMVADVAIDATENADLRISRFFPAKTFIGEIELESGIHHFKVEYYSKSGELLFTDDLEKIEVSSNKTNIFESFYLN